MPRAMQGGYSEAKGCLAEVYHSYEKEATWFLVGSSRPQLVLDTLPRGEVRTIQGHKVSRHLGVVILAVH